MQSRRSRSVSALRTRFRFCPLSSWQKTLKANLSWFGNGSGIACTYRKWATVSVPLRTGASVYREYLHARFPGSAGKRVRGAHGGGRVGRASPAQPGLVLDKIPGLPLALHDASFSIPGGSKCGVCGRTGAGKSTLAAALFRLTELASGTIKIDGVDIRSLGLHCLRNALAVVPQDPALFTGESP